LFGCAFFPLRPPFADHDPLCLLFFCLFQNLIFAFPFPRLPVGLEECWRFPPLLLALGRRSMMLTPPVPGYLTIICRPSAYDFAPSSLNRSETPSPKSFRLSPFFWNPRSPWLSISVYAFFFFFLFRGFFNYRLTLRAQWHFLASPPPSNSVDFRRSFFVLRSV